MRLKELRKKRGLTRKELAECSGINLRSLQDYEQGHKNVASMKGESLLRLSIALGCTVEEILCDYVFPEINGIEEPDKRRISGFLKKALADSRVYCEKYNIYGRWIPRDGYIELLFLYQGEFVRMETNAEVTEKTIPWLSSFAVMKIEDYVEQKQVDAIINLFTNSFTSLPDNKV